MSYFNNKTKGWILLCLPLVILVVLILIFKLLIVWPPIDIPAHILMGATISAVAILVYDFRYNVVIPGTFALLMIWEGFEMAGWRLFPFWNNCAYVFCDQDIFFWDGFWDVVFGMAAAVLLVLYLKWHTTNGKTIKKDGSKL